MPKKRNLSVQERNCRLEILENYFLKAVDVQTKIEEIQPNDEERENTEELYISAKLLLQVNNMHSGPHNSTTVEYSCLQTSSSKLPKLKLPSFGGQYSEFKNFYSSFQQIIDSELGLSYIEKFNYLLNCLHGQALETVKAFQVSKALGRLKAQFDNNSLIFLQNIVSLFKLPSISKANSMQLRSHVDNASALYDSLL